MSTLPCGLSAIFKIASSCVFCSACIVTALPFRVMMNHTTGTHCPKSMGAGLPPRPSPFNILQLTTRRQAGRRWDTGYAVVAILLGRAKAWFSHVTRCTICGAINRVPRYSISRKPICGSCHAELPETTTTKGLRYLHRVRYLAGVGFICALILLPWLYPLAPVPAPVPAPAASPAAIEQPAPIEVCTTYPQPGHGQYWPDTLVGPFAAFTIRTPAGANYFVKMEDTSGFTMAAFFIYGGSILDAKMPFGRFIMKYASGQHWCGDDELFGRDTAIQQADRVLEFGRHSVPGGYEINGHSVELIPQQGGNFGTRPIPRSAF
jgi:hypothetical protein